MSSVLTEILARHILQHKQEQLMNGEINQPAWLFVSKESQPLDPANVRKAMRNVLKKAKLPLHLTPHCLRHTYASLLLSEGFPAPYVQEQLVHATID